MREFRSLLPGQRLANTAPRRGLLAVIAATLLVGGLAGPTVLGGHASAAPLTPVVITGLAAAPVDGATITYGDTKVNVTGQLVVSKTKVGIPGETIAVGLDAAVSSGAGTEVGTATTGPDGTFSATVSLPWGGLLWAGFAGDATYAPVNDQAGVIRSTEAATRVTLGPLPAFVNADARVTLTGKAEVKVGSAWQPLPGVVVGGSPDASVADLAGSTTTKSDGSYTLSIPQPDYATWTAVVAEGQGEYPLYATSMSSFRGVGVVFRTRITAFTVPAAREAHQVFPVSGIAQVWNGTKWTGYFGLHLSYFYEKAGTTKWVFAGSAGTSASGKFAGGALIALGRLRWQARVTAYTSGDKYLSSASVTRSSFVTDHTCVTDINGNRIPSGTFVQGYVHDWCAAGGEESFGDVKGQLAKLYYRATATGSWRLLKQVRTDQYGFANFSLTGVPRGYFKINFPAQGYYLSSASKVLHLR
jgi:hypothetical protein